MNVKQFLTEVYKNIPKHEDVKITLEDYMETIRDFLITLYAEIHIEVCGH